MSFDWILANTDEEILAKHTGPAYGKATPFQVEGCGLLSIACFLHHVLIYTMQPIQCKLDFYIDNEGVVVRTKDQLSCKYDYSFSTLDPDWGIIAHAASTLKMWGKYPQITTIKSHQDDVTMEDNLDFSVQLNVAADQLATKYREQNNTTSLMTPRIDINNMQLQVIFEVITGHHYKKIQDHVTASDLQKHIVCTRQWQEEVFKSVDWDTYQQSKNRQDHRDS
eukprot:2187666-Ditylum_brightwellii.AAC.1